MKVASYPKHIVVACVDEMLAGFRPEEISAFYGPSCSSVRSWYKTYLMHRSRGTTWKWYP